jgi:hypothetical protein
MNVRHPLAIYNLSMSRICDKVRTCATKLEVLKRKARTVSELNVLQQDMEELVDYIELCLYSAVEHVDDIQTIAASCFKSKSDYEKSPLKKGLLQDMKVIRDRLAAIANAMKHQQARIRLYALEFKHAGQIMCLHGMFVEAFDKGTAGPSPILHAGVEKIISIPSFLWEVIVYLFEMSSLLHNFLKSVLQEVGVNSAPQSASPFAQSCIAVARIPNYSFDGAHPFEHVRVTFRSDEAHDELLQSGLYGSIRAPWSKDLDHSFGGFVLKYLGDGVSRSFAIVHPNTVRIQHWE